MSNKKYNKLRKYMKDLKQRIINGSKEGFEMLVYIGVYTKTGKLKGIYKKW